MHFNFLDSGDTGHKVIHLCQKDSSLWTPVSVEKFPSGLWFGVLAKCTQQYCPSIPLPKSHWVSTRNIRNSSQETSYHLGCVHKGNIFQVERQLLRVQSCLQRAFSYCLPSPASTPLTHTLATRTPGLLSAKCSQGSSFFRERLFSNRFITWPLKGLWVRTGDFMSLCHVGQDRGTKTHLTRNAFCAFLQENSGKRKLGWRRFTWNSLFPNCQSGIKLKELRSKFVGGSQHLKHPVCINEHRFCPATLVLVGVWTPTFSRNAASPTRAWG